MPCVSGVCYTGEARAARRQLTLAAIRTPKKERARQESDPAASTPASSNAKAHRAFWRNSLQMPSPQTLVPLLKRLSALRGGKLTVAEAKAPNKVGEHRTSNHANLSPTTQNDPF